MEKQFHYVYITTNLINGKQYIGDHSTNNLNDSYLGSGRPYLLNALKKYGKLNFERKILEYFDNKIDAFNAQKKWIKKYNTVYPNGYNLSPSGGLQCSHGWTDESKEKIRLSKIGNIPWNKNKTFSEESKLKMSISRTGKSHTKEHNENIGKSVKGKNKGKKRSNEFKERISQFQKGRKKSEETKEKLKKPKSEETKKKISESRKGIIPWNKGKKIKKLNISNMSEVREIKTKSVDERCPVCGQGWMRPTGVVLTSNPPQFPHKCTACNYEQTYQVRYPYVITQ